MQQFTDAEEFVAAYLTANPSAKSTEVMANRPEGMSGVYPALIGKVRRRLAGEPEPTPTTNGGMTLEQRVRALERAVEKVGVSTALAAEVKAIKRHIGL